MILFLDNGGSVAYTFLAGRHLAWMVAIEILFRSDEMAATRMTRNMWPIFKCMETCPLKYLPM